MKLNIDQYYKTKDIDEGVWFYVSDDVAFKVRSVYSNKITEGKRRAYLSKHSNNNQSVESACKFTAHVMITDWKGLEIDGEKVGKYDPKKMTEILVSMPALFVDIVNFANDKNNYLDIEDDFDDEVVDTTIKN